MKLELDLELITDACLSTANHTLGDPETHHYIPGRTLWGAIANQAYRSGNWTPEEAFRVFHQGSVSISDALPIDSEHRSYPTPLAWHEPKNTAGQNLRNFALESVREACRGEQHKGRKPGWISADGKEVSIKTDYSLRTSVDSSGKARDGLLFGLPVVRAGTRFHATLSGPEAEVEKLVRLFSPGELRVGRSKNSELGLLRVSRRGHPVGKLAHGKGASQKISIFCVSRCIVRDPVTGAPTLQPGPEVFGLPKDWNFDGNSSFLRSARVVHFNSKRGRPETERFAIERGSVLTFRGPAAVELQDVIRSVEGGVGEHCGEGYGEVLIAPTWLTEDKPFTVAKPEPAQVVQAKEPADSLFGWAKRRAQQKDRAISLYSEAQEQAEKLRRYRVPSSQWGVLRRMAREARFQPARASNLWNDVFSRDEKNPGFLGSGKRVLSQAWKRAAEPLEKSCGSYREDLPMFLEFLASACMRPAPEQNGEMS